MAAETSEIVIPAIVAVLDIVLAVVVSVAATTALKTLETATVTFSYQ